MECRPVVGFGDRRIAMIVVAVLSQPPILEVELEKDKRHPFKEAHRPFALGKCMDALEAIRESLADRRLEQAAELIVAVDAAGNRVGVIRVTRTVGERHRLSMQSKLAEHPVRQDMLAVEADLLLGPVTDKTLVAFADFGDETLPAAEDKASFFVSDGSVRRDRHAVI